MRVVAWAWLAAVIVGVDACGGAAFTSGGSDGGASGASSSGGTSSSSGASRDAGGSGIDGGGSASDGASSGGGGTQCGPGLLCTGTGGQQGTICCVGGATTGSPQYQCAGALCGCDTQIECASNADCGGSTPTCCIRQRVDTGCSGGHIVAMCSADCANGGQQACDPNASQTTCANGQQCASDPTCVGLPPSQGFGVCGGC